MDITSGYLVFQSIAQFSATCCLMDIASSHMVFQLIIVKRYLYPSEGVGAHDVDMNVGEVTISCAEVPCF